MNIKKINLAIIAGSLLTLSMSANAIPISTSDGVINSTAGTATYGEVATYVSGGTGLTGTGAVWPADVGDGIGNVSAEASNVDRYWIQYNSTGSGGPGAGSIILDFVNATANVIAVAGIDHPPLPYESLELIVWGWNGSSWEEGVITAIYDQGVDAAWSADDFSSVWSFSGAYTRFAVSGGTHYTGTGTCSTCTEGEFDALAAVSVPEPATLALLGLSLFGFGFARRRKI